MEPRPTLQQGTRKTNGPHGEARGARLETGQAATAREGLFEMRNVRLLRSGMRRTWHPTHDKYLDTDGKFTENLQQEENRHERRGEGRKFCDCSTGGATSANGEGSHQKPCYRDIQKKRRGARQANEDCDASAHENRNDDDEETNGAGRSRQEQTCRKCSRSARGACS